VVSVSQSEAGDGAFNVIPAKAVLCGTIQALSNESLLQLREGLLRIARSTAEAHGCKLAESTFSKDHFPVTMNDGELSPFAKRVAGMVAEGGDDILLFGSGWQCWR
jgi:metal-dependent amidase/aminoacylase/carboxypeptidase family protein